MSSCPSQPVATSVLGKKQQMLYLVKSSCLGTIKYLHERHTHCGWQCFVVQLTKLPPSVLVCAPVPEKGDVSGLQHFPQWNQQNWLHIFLVLVETAALGFSVLYLLWLCLQSCPKTLTSGWWGFEMSLIDASLASLLLGAGTYTTSSLSTKTASTSDPPNICKVKPQQLQTSSLASASHFSQLSCMPSLIAQQQQSPQVYVSQSAAGNGVCGWEPAHLVFKKKEFEAGELNLVLVFLCSKDRMIKGVLYSETH